jgi:glycine oxidase
VHYNYNRLKLVKKLKIAIIGDGISGLSIALKVLKNKNVEKICIFSKTNKLSGTLASGAMLNSFGEVELKNFKNFYFKKLLSIYIRSTSKWKNFVKLFKYNKHKDYFFEGKGTYVYLDKTQGRVEEENFNSIIKILRNKKEKFKFIKKNNFSFLSKNISDKLLFINNEKFLNSEKLYFCLKKFLQKNKKILFIKKNCSKINDEQKFVIASGKKYSFDRIILTCGSDFKKIIDKNISTKIMKQFYGLGYSLDIKTKDDLKNNFCFRSVNRGHACGIYLIPKTKKVFRVGATNQIWDKKKFVKNTQIFKELLKNFKKTFLINNFDLISINKGFRPISLDGYPIIGELKKHIYVVAGFGRAGWHCAPDTSDHIVNLMFNKKKNTCEYKYFSPFRKPIKNKKLIDDIIISEYSAYIQHNDKKITKKKSDVKRKKIKKNVLDVIKYHKLDKCFDVQIYPYLKYRKKIKKKFNIYEI